MDSGETRGNVVPEKRKTPRNLRSGVLISFLRNHPYFSFALLLIFLPLLGLSGIWVYLRMTTDRLIADQLHGLGLPANGLELESWRHPADDGRAEFNEALTMFDALSTRLGSTEFERLTSVLKPADYAANQPALESFFKSLQPIRQKMNEAARHAAITTGCQYRDGFDAKRNNLMQFRAYALAITLQACYESTINQASDAAWALLAELLTVNRKLSCYTTIENLVSLAVDGIAVKAVDCMLGNGGGDSQALQRISGLVLSAEHDQRYADNFSNSFVGELALVQSGFLRQRQSGFAPGFWDQFSGIQRLLFIVCRDVDRITLTSVLVDCYQRSRKSCPELSGTLLYVPSPGVHHCSWDRPLSPLLMTFLLGSENLFRNIGKTYFKSRAALLTAGIACLVAAERREGKMWPANLDDPRFPRDPCTAAPFKLIVTPDALLIYSIGVNQKDSGKVALFNRTGNMENNHDVPAVAGEDDIVFRLQRAPYEKASSALPPSAP